MRLTSRARPAVLVLLTLTLTVPAPAATQFAALSDQAIVRPRQEPVLPSVVREYVTARDGREAVTVWVFFTDKQLPPRTPLSAAAAVSFPERTRERRARMGRDRTLFADIPVPTQYVDAVVALGARHRRTSRWLNAASFDMPVTVLDQVAQLPFVAEVRPVVKFRKTYETPTPDRGDRAPETLDALALNYGTSLDQLQQINVPAAHNRGLSGKGVTLAIMDTGFRKSHEAFADHWANGRVLAEYDFVFNDTNTANEAGDVSNQWDHGTLIWSVSGGKLDGKIYGPAYEANFILCKTEDLRSETPVEEDNWVAALEFSDSVGADVITTSLGYSDWYTYADFDGQTATITIAANTAAGLGIVMCNSMGNGGPALGTLTAPADAFDILAVGAVDANGVIASFSSRGPTFDGRPKPEVVARGVATYAATATANNTYGFASGTSLSTPLVAGLACLVREANPCLTPLQVREAIMMTADRAANPDSTTYGWGIPDAVAAIDYDSCATPCCVGSTGNVNGDPGDIVDIADLTVLIDHLFINFLPLSCPEEANVSGDPDGVVDIADLTALIDHLFINFTPTAPCQ